VGMSISGQGSFDLEGTFYAANAQLKVTGSGTATIGSQYISRTLTLGGSGAVKINYTDGGTAPLREERLVAVELQAIGNAQRPETCVSGLCRFRRYRSGRRTQR